MSWHEQLRPASFRGVAFYAVSDSATFGRRSVLHDFPFRDLPYVEDMGRKAREIRVVGFVIGADYMAARDALIEAAEQPGPGKLVHPQYGELTVSISDGGFTVDHSNAEGGCARISFTCVESGEARFPSSQVATQEVVSSRADDALAALKNRFTLDFRIDNLPAFFQDDAIAQAAGFLDQVTGTIGETAGAIGRGDVLALVDAISPQLGSLLRTPAVMADRVQAIVGSVRGAMPARSAVGALAKLATFGAGNPHLPQTTATRLRQAANRETFTELVRGSAAVERARSVASLEFSDIQDALAVRDSVVDQLDQVSDVSSDDGVFGTLSALRAAVVRDIGARGADLARVVSVTLPATTPALVMAYDLLGDASRDSELLARNNIIHPGFLPAGVPLEVPIDA